MPENFLKKIFPQVVSRAGKFKKNRKKFKKHKKVAHFPGLEPLFLYNAVGTRYLSRRK